SSRVSLPRLLSLSWDIESSETRGSGFFPLGHEPTSYVSSSFSFSPQKAIWWNSS
ncbi:26936_t:CDS:2, partial [Dentiscutata erythropus]